VYVCVYVCVTHSAYVCVMVWLQENDYEWGGPGTEIDVSHLIETMAKLARAARRWRIKLSEHRMVSFHLVHA